MPTVTNIYLISFAIGVGMNLPEYLNTSTKEKLLLMFYLFTSGTFFLYFA